MLVDDEDTLHRPAHPHFIKLLPHPLEARCHRAVLLIQRLLGAESVVGQRVSGRERHKDTDVRHKNQPSKLTQLTGHVFVFVCLILCCRSTLADTGSSVTVLLHMNSQVDGPLQGERLRRPADVFVPELNGTTARPAGGRATRRHHRHLYREHDETKPSCERASSGGWLITRLIIESAK